MKRLSTYLLAGIALLSASCSDFLDTAPKDALSPATTWKTETDAESFVVGCYNGLLDPSSILYLDCGSDIGYNNFSWEGWRPWGDGSLSSGNTGASFYDFAIIRRCNTVLENIDNVEFTTAGKKEELIAEAKAIRAYRYFIMNWWYGGVPIIGSYTTAEEAQVPRNTEAEVREQIAQDLDDALTAINTTPAARGRIAKGAVLATKMREALYYGDWQKAKDAAQAIIDLKQYELDSDYENLFKLSGIDSKEIILAQWKHETNTQFSNTWIQGLIPNVNNDKIKEFANPPLVDNFEGWPSTFPSCDLIDAYEVIDEDGQAKDWDKTSYYQNYITNGGYVSNAIYKNRDKRFYATIVQDSSKYFNSIVTMRDKGNLHWNSRVGGDWGSALTGYLYRKGVYTDKKVWYSDPTYYHYVIMRLGRAYLNYAEVMLRQGNIQTAIEYINKTRTTHGGLPALSTSLSLDEAWKVYKRERRVELVHEGDRYWSLLRWGKADGKTTVEELNKTHHSISISEDGKSFEIIPLPFRTSENERIFTKKRYLFPVPEGERVNNPALDQNEGW